MARIFFWTWDEPGHVNPALALAKRLEARGHVIEFISGRTVAPLIEPYGFKVHAPPFSAYRGPIAPHTTMHEVVESIRSLGAELILCDAIKTFEVVVSLNAGVRCAVYSTGLPFWSDPIGPSINTAAKEPANWIERMRISAEWTLNRIRQRQNRKKSLSSNPGYAMVNRFFEDSRESLGFENKDVEWNTNTVVPLPYFRHIPTLIMCPKMLDFPRADDDRLHWIDACILRDRTTVSAPTYVNPDIPLIFVSLGTQIHRIQQAGHWFAAVCDVLARHPEWQAVLSVGPVLFPKLQAREIPGRLTILPYADQMSLLGKAAVAVIHGGLNSIKECITAGVPMAVFPTGFDQPGNAVRVFTRGLGLTGSIEEIHSDQFERMLRKLIDDPKFRTNIAAVRAEFLRIEELDSGAVAVESLLAGS